MNPKRYTIRKMDGWWTVTLIGLPISCGYLCRASSWETARDWLCRWTGRS